MRAVQPHGTAAGTAYHNGDPINGSVVDAQFFNVVNRELTHLVEFSGQAPSADDADLQQVRKSVQAMIAAAVVDTSGFLPKSGGGMTGAFAEAWAGSNITSAPVMDIWSKPGNYLGVDPGPNPVVTSLGVAPQSGAYRRLWCLAGTTFVHSGSMRMQGGQNYTTQYGDIVYAYADGPNRFDLTIFKVDGTAIVERGTPPGTIIYTASSAVPTGFLKANGALVGRADAPNLFAAIGTTYGAGDGSTTFNVPDLRGEFIRGWDDGRGVDAGRLLGGLQAADVQAHSHPLPWRSSGQAFSGGVSSYPAVESYPGGLTNNSTGTETRPRNVALLACIKY